MKVNVTRHPTRPGWYYLEFRPNGVKGGIKRIPIEGYEEAHAQANAMMQRVVNPDIKLKPVTLLDALQKHSAKESCFTKMKRILLPRKHSIDLKTGTILEITEPKL